MIFHPYNAVGDNMDIISDVQNMTTAKGVVSGRVVGFVVRGYLPSNAAISVGIDNRENGLNVGRVVSPMAMETGRTLAGTSVVWSQVLSGGRPVTLVAEDGVTWMSLEAVESLMNMASQAGAVFPLRWGDEVFISFFGMMSRQPFLFGLFGRIAESL